VEDLDIAQNKLADSGQRVVDRALEEAPRREDALVTKERFCLAFAQVKLDIFGQLMRGVMLNQISHEIPGAGRSTTGRR
jgi:hypothetical protein